MEEMKCRFAQQATRSQVCMTIVTFLCPLIAHLVHYRTSTFFSGSLWGYHLATLWWSIPSAGSLVGIYHTQASENHCLTFTGFTSLSYNQWDLVLPRVRWASPWEGCQMVGRGRWKIHRRDRDQQSGHGRRRGTSELKYLLWWNRMLRTMAIK